MTSNSSDRNTAEIITPGLGDIEKVRDILFGKYAQSFETQFSTLETRLESDIELLKERLNLKIEGLDTVVSDAIESINQKMDSEQVARAQGLASMNKNINDAQVTLEHSINLLEDQSNQDLSALKKSLNESQNEFLNQLERMKRELTEQTQEYKNQLQTEKVSKESLAYLMDEIAMKLRSKAD